MTATAQMIADVRGMTGEPTTTTYSDTAIRRFIERYPATDERGVEPYYYDTMTSPPTQVAVTSWYPTYDLHAAAADIWEEKAAATADQFDYPIQEPSPGIFRHSQQSESFMKQARYHRSRRRVTTATLMASPSRYPYGNSVIGNLGEDP